MTTLPSWYGHCSWELMGLSRSEGPASQVVVGRTSRTPTGSVRARVQACLVTHRRPGPGKVVSPRDVCPDTGLARLS
ncbi:hypothetical protein Srubr_28270 [Streptomyces rubradiris]|uniref:Uncharacterized protein n=1 Tax=Streptomyces rubradiris TaxID=285531 RepID=A0ABQ3RAU5_STRRR|nr:hypothetical protein GCM10018792_51150 [Streptomyces rubradiris]GHI52981.1 hypothetical protein Srubr_28270 [Streptomyces rubradiris]